MGEQYDPYWEMNFENINLNKGGNYRLINGLQ